MAFESKQSAPRWRQLLEASKLASDTFEVSLNVRSASGKRVIDGADEVLRVMRDEQLDFDEARLHIVNEKLRAMGCDESGMPTDPRAFTFSAEPRRSTSRELAVALPEVVTTVASPLTCLRQVVIDEDWFARAR